MVKRMPNNDFFKIVYIILYNLYKTKREGKILNVKDINHEALNIPYGYYVDIISELIDNGLVKGARVKPTKTTRVLCLNDMRITMKGIVYLQENSNMKKIYKKLKELKDWIPLYK